MSDVTRILVAIHAGDRKSADELLPLVYHELRRLAAQKMAHERPGQTLQATALVHEAYLRLLGNAGGQSWENRRHFFAAAAEAMRRILIEQARRRHSLQRGGRRQRIELHEDDLAVTPADDDLLDLDAALSRFRDVDPQAAELVSLRLFAGMTLEVAADCLGISRRTAARNWAYARAWLRDAIRQGEAD